MAGPLRRRTLIAAAGGIAVLVLGAAALAGVLLTQPGGGPVRLTAEVDQRYRFDEASGVLPVLLRSNEDETVTVTRLELIAPSVVTGAEVDEITVRPGQTRRIRLPLRPARCPLQGPPSSGPAVVVVTVTSAGDAGREVRLPAADPEHLLDRIARADCDIQRVLRVVDIEFGTEWRRFGDGAPVLRGDLVLARRAARPAVTVTGIRGSIIVDLRPSSQPPWRLSAGERRLDVPVEATAGRCDRHALMESKKTLVFSVWAKLPGEDVQHLTLRPDPSLENRLYQLIADGCEDAGD